MKEREREGERERAGERREGERGRDRERGEREREGGREREGEREKERGRERETDRQRKSVFFIFTSTNVSNFVDVEDAETQNCFFLTFLASSHRLCCLRSIDVLLCLMHSIITIFVRGSITVRLTFCWARMSSTKQAILVVN